MLQNAGRKAVIILLSLVFCLTVLSTVLVVGFTAWALSSSDRSVREELLLAGSTDHTTRIYGYDENGEVTELTSDRISGYHNALYAPLSEIPKNLQNAFIAIEDKRFWKHGGIDYIRTASAFRGFLSGDMSFGGSTLTQQLVKNLTGESERSIRRKISEMRRAVRLERDFSKRQILEQYLNVVNLAQGCYGVKTAANVYFSKEPAELTLAECATIAAITNNPSGYDPIRHPEANQRRRDLILREMLAQGMIDEAACLEAMALPVVLHVDRSALSSRVNSFYADMVIEDVIKDLMRERHMTRAEASTLLYYGGLKIYTPMDRRLQALFTAYYEDTCNFPTHGNGEKAQSAAMLVDPETGHILAVAGAVGKKDSNRVQSFAVDSKRPSGSVIKPLSVYAPALESGAVTYATVFDDIPLSYKKSGAPWPRNSPDIYRGLTTVGAALTHSVNTVSVSILNRLGAEHSYRFLRDKLGFTSMDATKDVGVVSLALGQQTTGVTLREVVGGYTALANEGVYRGTHSYLRVENSGGEVLLQAPQTAVRAISAENAAILTQMLCRAVREGTGAALSLKDTVEVAGKTGTSSQNCDKWFVGYTPSLLMGVWYGHEYPKSLSDVKGNPSLSIFDALMAEVIRITGGAGERFSIPENVVTARYCKDSGLLPSAACAHDPRGCREEIGYFVRGTAPIAHCSTHKLIEYCSCGGVATESCPHEGRFLTALLDVQRSFPRQIRVLDAPYTRAGACEAGGEIYEPYYAPQAADTRYFGIGMGVLPYNHACPVHTADDFWRRRAGMGA